MKQLTSVPAEAIHSHVSGLSVVLPQVQRYQERKKKFSSGRIASGYLPLICLACTSYNDEVGMIPILNLYYLDDDIMIHFISRVLW